MLPATLTKAYQSLTTIKIIVNSAETRAAVSAHWGSCTKFIKDTKKAILELKRPFKDEIDKIDMACKPMLDKASELERQAEQAILAYDRAERAKIQAQNQKKIEKYETKVATMEAEAVANNKPVPLVNLPNLKQEPAKTIVVGDLKQTTVVRKDWRLPDNLKWEGDPATLTAQDAAERGSPIPLKYFVLDTAKIGKVIRSRDTIPGIEDFEVESLSGRVV